MAHYQKGQQQDTPIARDLTFIMTFFPNPFALVLFYLWKMDWWADSWKWSLKRTPQVKLTLLVVGNTSVNSSLCIGATVSDAACIQMHFSEEKWGQWVIVVSNNKIIVFKPAVDYYWWQELLGGTCTLKGSEQCTRTATARLLSDPKTGYNAAKGKGGAVWDAQQ